jgi:hypothetical protein
MGSVSMRHHAFELWSSQAELKVPLSSDGDLPAFTERYTAIWPEILHAALSGDVASGAAS